jgi:DNA-binding MarR family transcriptional regulator
MMPRATRARTQDPSEFGVALQGWSQEHAWPQPADDLRLEVLQDMRMLSTADASMNEAAAAVLGVHTTDLHAGEALDRLGPMTIGELARTVGLSPGAATALVDRLEAAGLATRVPDPSNRRRILVKPSIQARRRADAAFGGLIQKGTTFLDRYSDDELLIVRDFLREAQSLIIEHADALRNLHPSTPADSRRAGRAK